MIAPSFEEALTFLSTYYGTGRVIPTVGENGNYMLFLPGKEHILVVAYGNATAFTFRKRLWNKIAKLIERNGSYYNCTNLPEMQELLKKNRNFMGAIPAFCKFFENPFSDSQN